MKHLLFILSFLLCLQMHGQHDNTWYFGDHGGISFSTGSPLPLANNPLYTYEGTSVISDENGQFMFFTNGVTVYNKDLQIMPNGNGLHGDQSATQSSVVIQKPAQPGKYYIFTVDDANGPMGLKYSEVDMTLNNGLGNVTVKNISLHAPICEKIAAAYHPNGIDMWIIVRQYGSNAFYSYLVTTSGVSSVPVISTAGIPMIAPSNYGISLGYMTLSPNGTKLATGSFYKGIELFDFDNATGIISNAQTLKDTGDQHYGIEFSPKGNFLYATSDKNLYQYDLNASDVALSQTLISNITIPGAMKIGPDSKIYVVDNMAISNLSVISNPDAKDIDCNFELHKINISGKTQWGLPAFFVSPFYITDILSDNLCADSQVNFSVESTQQSEKIEWDFGDGSTSDEINPTHIYTSPGTYTVKVTANKGLFVRYYTKQIIIKPEIIVNKPEDLFNCDATGDEKSEFDLSAKNSEILGILNPSEYSISYHLAAADAENGINAITTPYTNIQNPQLIYARVTSSSGCHTETSFSIVVYARPEINMKNKFFICENAQVTLTAPNGFYKYKWSDGRETQSISVTQPGIYTLTVYEKHDNLICEESKQITVSASEKPIITRIEINDFHDLNTIQVSITGKGDYEYSLDGIHYQPENIFYNVSPGLYTIYVRDLNGCGTVKEEIAVLMYPRFFTPNGDGENEIWQIKYAYIEPSLQIYIFDRYGKIVSSFTGNQTGWDGTLNGTRLPASDYWFVAKRFNGSIYKGHFSLIR